jgi:hypothetical protein
MDMDPIIYMITEVKHKLYGISFSYIYQKFSENVDKLSREDQVIYCKE